LRRRKEHLAAGNFTGLALAVGLAGELSVSVVPVGFGSGVLFFGDYCGSPVLLDNLQVVAEAG
jgi:hypothetical protein